MNGPGTDIKCRSDIALQRVTHHEKLRGQNLQTLTELRELCFGFITGDFYMREILIQMAAIQLILLILQLAFGKHHKTIGIGLQTLQCFLYLRQWCGRQMQQLLAVRQQLSQLGMR